MINRLKILAWQYGIARWDRCPLCGRELIIDWIDEETGAEMFSCQEFSCEFKHLIR